jgi:hypothetical protein
MSNINDFSEKDIRNAILRKAPLKNINKNSKHWKGYIEIDGKIVGKVKIPNEHDRVMHASKSQYIATDLKLNAEQFNAFIECTLKAEQYCSLMKQLI